MRLTHALEQSQCCATVGQVRFEAEAGRKRLQCGSRTHPTAVPCNTLVTAGHWLPDHCKFLASSVLHVSVLDVWFLQKPFRTEAPLLMEIFQQVFQGATAADLARATAPVAVQRQPGPSRQASIVRPKGDAPACFPMWKDKPKLHLPYKRLHKIGSTYLQEW